MHVSSVAKFGLTLCDPMDCSLPGSSMHGISQARILECFATSYSWGYSWPRIEPKPLASPALAGRVFTTALPGKPLCTKLLSNSLEYYNNHFFSASDSMDRLLLLVWANQTWLMFAGFAHEPLVTWQNDQWLSESSVTSLMHLEAENQLKVEAAGVTGYVFPVIKQARSDLPTW